MLLSIALGLTALTADAHAKSFEDHTFREPLSSREIERGLILSKGWLEFGLGADYKNATGYWDEDGVARDFENAQFLYTTERIDFRYAIARRLELYGQVPFHYLKLTNETMGTDLDQFGVGDPRFGMRWEPYHADAPLTSVIVYGEYKAPLGNEAPGTYIGGPDGFSRFILTTGTPDGTVGIRAKRQFGPLALTGGLAWVHRFSGITMYIIETTNYQFSGRIKPGDLTVADLDAMLQAGPVAFHTGPILTLRDATRLGTTSAGLFPDENLVVQEGSDGTAVDWVGGVVVNVTRNIDLDLAARQPIRGEDLMYFPIEDIHPTRGTTLSGTFEFRY